MKRSQKLELDVKGTGKNCALFKIRQTQNALLETVQCEDCEGWCAIISHKLAGKEDFVFHFSNCCY